MAVNGRESVTQFLASLEDMNTLFTNAPKNFVFSDKCSLPRNTVLESLGQMRSAVPQAVADANAILEEETNIRETAEKAAQETVSKANAEAAEIVAGAKQELDVLNQQIEVARREVEETRARCAAQAQQMAQQAQADADKIIQQANAQAQQIVSNAETHAQELIKQENVYRRAEVKAEEMMESTRNEMAHLRSNTFDYLDDLLGQAERYVTGLVNDVRQERDSVNGAR